MLRYLSLRGRKYFVAPDTFYLVGGTRNGSFDSEGADPWAIYQ